MEWRDQRHPGKWAKPPGNQQHRLMAVGFDLYCPGLSYRLRFIGATALSFVSLSIESHDVATIEADGHYTTPLNTSFLQIGSSQRYGVLLKAKSEAALKKARKR